MSCSVVYKDGQLTYNCVSKHYFKAPGTTKWHEIGRTETIWDNLNPDWEKKFQMEYHFEVHQMLRFTIYDIDSESRNLANHDFLGQMTCSLGEIVTNQARVGLRLDNQTIREGVGLCLIHMCI